MAKIDFPFLPQPEPVRSLLLAASDVLGQLNETSRQVLLDALKPFERITTQVVESPEHPVCKQCGSALVRGYCVDSTCLYSDWTQDIPRELPERYSAKDVEALTGRAKRIRVRAEVHSDDRAMEVVVDDVAAWFEEARPEDVLALDAHDWGGCEAADDVALFFARQGIAGMHDENPALAALFAYVRGRRSMGFECQVDAGQAMAWLRRWRPMLALAIQCQVHGVKFSRATVKDTSGQPVERWSWTCDHVITQGGLYVTLDDAARQAAVVLGLRQTPRAIASSD